MKMIRKIFALLTAVTMVFGMSAAAFAAVETDAGKGGAASITISLPADNAGTDELITYSVFKVFGASTNGTAISYKIDPANGALDSAMKAAGFFLDDGGNVHFGTFTEDAAGTYMVGGKKGTITAYDTLGKTAMDAVAAYAADKIGDFGARPSEMTLKITGLEYGYYFITTTTGTVVTVDSTKPDAEVEDKNAIPGAPDKKITGVTYGSFDAAGQNALAQVGTDVTFSAQITKVRGAVNYVFHDTMSAGLLYNGDVRVFVNDAEIPAGETVNTEADDETFAKGAAGTDTITLFFDNDWLAALADDTVITITYSAAVTSEALSINAAENTASLDYGDGHTTDTDTVKVFNAKFTVTKQDGQGAPLAGAGFVVRNTDGKYYRFDPAAAAAEDDPETEEDESAAATDVAVRWVASINDATEYISDEAGAVQPFTGLADGTYTLVEKTVPDGYNRAAEASFTIREGDYTAANTEQACIVVNESGTELPSTGGIGTTVFYILGAVLVITAGAVLVTRRRIRG